MGGADAAADIDTVRFTAEPPKVVQLTEQFLKFLHIPPRMAPQLRAVFACSVDRLACGRLKRWLPRALIVTETGQIVLFDTNDGRVTHETSLRHREPIPDSEGGRRFVVQIVLESSGEKTTTTTLWLRITQNNSSSFAAILRFRGSFELLPTALLRVILCFVPRECVSVRMCTQKGPIVKLVPKELHSIPRATHSSDADRSSRASSSSHSQRVLYMTQVVLEERKRLKTLRAEMEERQVAEVQADCNGRGGEVSDASPITGEEGEMPHDCFVHEAKVSPKDGHDGVDEAHDSVCAAEVPQSPSPVDEERSEPSQRQDKALREGLPTEWLLTEAVDVPPIDIHPLHSDDNRLQQIGGGSKESLGFVSTPAAVESAVLELAESGALEKLEILEEVPSGTVTRENSMRGAMPGEVRDEEEKVVGEPSIGIERGQEKRKDPLSLVSDGSVAAIPIIGEWVNLENSSCVMQEGSTTEIEDVDTPPPLPPPVFLRIAQEANEDTVTPLVNEHDDYVESSVVRDITAIELVPPQEKQVVETLRVNGDHILSVYSIKRDFGNYHNHLSGDCDKNQPWRQVYERNVGRKSGPHELKKRPVAKIYSRNAMFPFSFGSGEHASKRIDVGPHDPHSTSVPHNMIK